MSFIERIGQKRVGFYCWKLFIINHFRGYEVSLLYYLYFFDKMKHFL